MHAIRHALQRDVFTARDERLLGVVHVTKNGKTKSKKNNFLCLAVTSEQPVQVYICVVKKGSRADEPYKRHIQWSLKDLRKVEALESRSDFDLVFDKLYRWEAGSESERENFLNILVKLAHRYLGNEQLSKIEFKGIEDVGAAATTKYTSAAAELDGDELKIADYQELSEVEQSDLLELIGECEGALANAEEFTTKLAANLGTLDGDNMNAIMESDRAIQALMKTLEAAVEDVTRVEIELDKYDQMLGSIDSQMGAMKSQQSFIQISDVNQTRLIGELEKLVGQLEMRPEHKASLQSGGLDSEEGIKAVIKAAEQLSRAMAIELPQGLATIQAVVEKQKEFQELRRRFSKRLEKHLTEKFNALGDTRGEASDNGVLKLPRHHKRQKRLLVYRPLIKWLQLNDSTAYHGLIASYTNVLKRVYQQEIRQFRQLAEKRFDEQVARKEEASLKKQSTKSFTGSSSHLGSTKSLSKSKFGGSIKNMSKSTVSLGMKKVKKFGSTLSIGGSKSKTKMGSMTSINSATFGGIDLSEEERTRFSETMREILNELEPVCQGEQDFIINFFHLTAEDLAQGDAFIDNEGEESERKREQNIDTMVGKEIKRLMGDIFGGDSDSLEEELSKMIEFGDELDRLNSLSLLVVLGERVLREKTQTFLGKLLGHALVTVKRSFDRFINEHIEEIQERSIKPTKKQGILWFVRDFENLANLAETIFEKAERRVDLNRAYTKLMRAVFEGIDRNSKIAEKTPPEVVRFQNYHHCFAILSELRIESLRSEQQEAKTLYKQNVTDYAREQLGRPLEKVSMFFDGVTQELDNGRREEEIRFLQMFNKSELKKAIKQYPGKKVETGLRELYQRVEKHTTEDGNRLLQVVWREMQDEFIRQYTHYDNLIERCYTGTNVRMEFSLQDCLNYFSGIAMEQ